MRQTTFNEEMSLTARPSPGARPFTHKLGGVNRGQPGSTTWVELRTGIESLSYGWVILQMTAVFLCFFHLCSFYLCFPVLRSLLTDLTVSLQRHQVLFYPFYFRLSRFYVYFFRFCCSEVYLILCYSVLTFFIMC